MAVLSSFFQVFIVLGMHNFDTDENVRNKIDNVGDGHRPSSCFLPSENIKRYNILEQSYKIIGQKEIAWAGNHIKRT